ncbi:MAG: hypothetical protein K1X56_08920 [Flavobacteriales bacterium]|nr:hypothetical protein [Flavobacteriales bacterium]
MENSETLDWSQNTQGITDEHKQNFRAAGGIIKGYSITILVLLGLFALILLLVMAMGSENITSVAKRGMRYEERAVFDRIWPIVASIIYLIIVLVGIYIFGTINLLRSGNALTELSHSGSMEDLRKSIAGMKKFWMIAGIGIIAAFVVVIYLVARIVPVIMELQGR